MQRNFLARVFRMIARKHRMDLTNALWLISLALFILTIFGVISTTGNLRIASITVLIIIACLYFWHFLIAIPAEVLKEAEEEAKPILVMKEAQIGHEEQWLRVVIEWIDLSRQWLSPNQVMLKYQIDSGLVYDFKPYRMWLKLKIGQYEAKDGWEILQTPNLLRGKRSQSASEVFTVNDDGLLKIIEGCREGMKIAQTLKIIVQLRDGDELRELGQSYSVNPYSEFVEPKELGK